MTHFIPVATETLPEYAEMPIHFCQQFRSLGLTRVMEEQWHRWNLTEHGKTCVHTTFQVSKNLLYFKSICSRHKHLGTELPYYILKESQHLMLRGSFCYKHTVHSQYTPITYMVTLGTRYVHGCYQPPSSHWIIPIISKYSHIQWYSKYQNTVNHHPGFDSGF